MRSITRACVVLLPLLVVGGCIVGDELTTLTIQPDGSADMVVFRSNLRSTQKGDEAEKELADYRAQFDARAGDNFDRIRNAGGKIEETVWIRKQAPFSNALRAHFPDAAALEKFATAKDEDGNFAVTTHFHSDGSLRRLTIQITVSPEKVDTLPSAPLGVEELLQKGADGLSATRVAVAKGSITSARGFTVARDKQSALLNVVQIAEMVREGKGKAEPYLEWDLSQ